MIIATLATAQFVPQKPSQWYSIEPWEAAVCQKWGGRAQALENHAVPQGLTGFGPFTYTLLGKKRFLDGENQTFYTYAYYFESYSAQLTYSIDLYNEHTQRRLPLASGTLNPGNGVQDQRADYLTENFTHIRLIHQLGRVDIPLIEEGTR